MGKKISSIVLKNRMIYKTDFDTKPTDKDEHTSYEEIIIYDGGGVEEYGDSNKNN